MKSVSVKLPHKSTANLPDAEIIRFGHSTEMDLASILARIDERLEELGLSDNAASMKAKKPDAIRNMRRALETGRKGVTTGTLKALAPVLGVSEAWLSTGIDAPLPSSGSGLDMLRAERNRLHRELESIEHAIYVLEKSAQKSA